MDLADYLEKEKESKETLSKNEEPQDAKVIALEMEEAMQSINRVVQQPRIIHLNGAIPKEKYALIMHSNTKGIWSDPNVLVQTDHDNKTIYLKITKDVNPMQFRKALVEIAEQLRLHQQDEICVYKSTSMTTKQGDQP